MKIEEISPGSGRYREMLAFRLEHLRAPLGLEFSEADIAEDSDDRHFVMLDPETETVIGCAVMVEKSERVAKVRQVAIAPEIQGKGLGRKLMEAVERAAVKSGKREVILHAREIAGTFYEKIGYEIEGEPFIEIGLPHLRMRKSIS